VKSEIEPLNPVFSFLPDLSVFGGINKKITDEGPFLGMVWKPFEKKGFSDLKSNI